MLQTVDEVADLPSKRMRNKIAGYVTVIDRLMDNKVTAVNLGSFNDENKPDFIKELKLLGR